MIAIWDREYVVDEIITINTDVVLRKYNVTDAPALFAQSDRNRAYLESYLPWVKDLVDVNGSVRHIEDSHKKWAAGDSFVYGIFYSGELIGDTAVMGVKSDLPEIGYWIAQDFAGRGIVTSIAKKLAGLCLSKLTLDKIYIRARYDNKASNRVAEKAGFRLVDTMLSDNERLNVWQLTRDVAQ